jgi:hypothetical protein
VIVEFGVMDRILDLCECALKTRVFAGLVKDFVPVGHVVKH